MAKIIRSLFIQYRDCPICHAPEAVTIPTKAANFFRCKKNATRRLSRTQTGGWWRDWISIQQDSGNSAGPFQDYSQWGVRNAPRYFCPQQIKKGPLLF